MKKIIILPLLLNTILFQIKAAELCNYSVEKDRATITSMLKKLDDLSFEQKWDRRSQTESFNAFLNDAVTIRTLKKENLESFFIPIKTELTVQYQQGTKSLAEPIYQDSDNYYANICESQRVTTPYNIGIAAHMIDQVRILALDSHPIFKKIDDKYKKSLQQSFTDSVGNAHVYGPNLHVPNFQERLFLKDVHKTFIEESKDISNDFAPSVYQAIRPTIDAEIWRRGTLLQNSWDLATEHKLATTALAAATVGGYLALKK